MSIIGLHHIVLFCQDTAASKRWYEKAGFGYLRGYEGMHWFSLGEAAIMLHPASGLERGQMPSLHAAVTDLDTLFERVTREGLTPLDNQQGGRAIDAPVVRDWGDREFELVDPDGHSWAFTEVEGD